mgnify:CR=1 FL=1
MSKINVKPEYRELVGMFNELAGSRSLWQIYNDCVEMFAVSIRNIFIFGKKHEQNEEEYKRVSSNYSKAELDKISQIFAKIFEMLEENPFRDLLGDLYMQLNMGSDALGQVFTPYGTSYMMSEMTCDIELIKREIESKGYIRIAEPSCGGGANIISLCEVLKNNDINYQNQCVIVCQDLSRIAALMCYTVLSLIGCSAVIKIGDSLCDPFTNYKDELAKGSDIWTTPMFHLNNCYRKV